MVAEAVGDVAGVSMCCDGGEAAFGEEIASDDKKKEDRLSIVLGLFSLSFWVCHHPVEQQPRISYPFSAGTSPNQVRRPIRPCQLRCQQVQDVVR
jgi:hypothetical protein